MQGKSYISDFHFAINIHRQLLHAALLAARISKRSYVESLISHGTNLIHEKQKHSLLVRSHIKGMSAFRVSLKH